MATWDDFARELDAWRFSNRRASFWWRDDDAVRVTPALERLVALSAAATTPLSLAVIPRDADNGLREWLAGQPNVNVLQHGWSHENHAPAGRQEEFGPHRPLPAMLDELALGWRRIAGFARSFPVFVAPWNRMDRHLLSYLGRAGLRAVSTLGPRGSPEACAGVRQTNVHVDIIHWQDTPGFIGLEAALEQVVTHLRQRRSGEADADEPTGLMTHHGFHDEGCWRFVEEFLYQTDAHPAAYWLAAKDAFWP
jgi:hypothetical protein